MHFEIAEVMISTSRAHLRLRSVIVASGAWGGAACAFAACCLARCRLSEAVLVGNIHAILRMRESFLLERRHKFPKHHSSITTADSIANRHGTEQRRTSSILDI